MSFFLLMLLLKNKRRLNEHKYLISVIYSRNILVKKHFLEQDHEQYAYPCTMIYLLKNVSF